MLLLPDLTKKFGPNKITCTKECDQVEGYFVQCTSSTQSGFPEGIHPSDRCILSQQHLLASPFQSTE